MAYNRFIISALLALIFISAVISGGMNTCGIVGDNMPVQQSDCLSDKNLTSGALCCYLSAYPPFANSTLASACTLLPPGVNQTLIGQAAQALGFNSTFSCEEPREDKKTDEIEITDVAIISVFLIICALVVVLAFSHK